MVQSKQIIAPLINREPKYCFNSTLVQSKRSSVGDFKTTQNEFQFHTGSIKTVKIAGKIKLSNLFQFHTGSIKT